MGKGTRSVVPTRVLSTELIATYGAVPGRCPEQSKHRKPPRSTTHSRLLVSARATIGRANNFEWTAELKIRRRYTLALKERDLDEL